MFFIKQVREDVLGIVRAVSGLSIMPEDVMTQSGMDSLTGVELKHRLERVYGINLPTSAAFEYPTVSALATFVHCKVRTEMMIRLALFYSEMMRRVFVIRF